MITAISDSDVVTVTINDSECSQQMVAAISANSHKQQPVTATGK